MNQVQLFLVYLEILTKNAAIVGIIHIAFKIHKFQTITIPNKFQLMKIHLFLLEWILHCTAQHCTVLLNKLELLAN